MLDLKAKYEILSFSVGDTKAGTKMGKMQLKNLNDNSIMNCVLWEETLNRTEDIATRSGNIIKIITASYNDKYNNCLLNNFFEQTLKKKHWKYSLVGKHRILEILANSSQKISTLR